MTTSVQDPAVEALPEHLGVYVYGVVPAGSVDLAGMTGVDGAEVETIEHDGLAAVVGVIEVERPPGRRHDVVAHSDVLDALAGSGTVVPVQFGSVLPDRESVIADFLEPHAERFTSLLENLAGRRQFTVRARYNEQAVLAEVVAENPEIADLRARTRDLPEEVGYADRVRLGELVARAMEDKREHDSNVVLDVVLPHVTDHVSHRGGGVDHLLEIAVLVDDERRAAFEDALEAVAEAVHERAVVELLGPLPPYDFVEG